MGSFPSSCQTIPTQNLSHAGDPGLVFTSDCKPGIRRVRQGKGFLYVLPNGRRVTDPAQLARIRRLAIPPAYEDVWICTNPRGHLQATGRDARGRKQYRYHPDWRVRRDAVKFDSLLEFARCLPRIHRRVAQDLRKPGLPREKVLATIVKLLEFTRARVGNEEYVRENGSFGLTTLRDRHVKVNGNTLQFEFRGKSGIVHHLTVSDPALARIVRRCADIPGQELFQWIDAQGQRHRIDSKDVNEYLREASGSEFSAKHFRTWFATTEALEGLARLRAGSKREVKRRLNQVIAAVAVQLGNTPAVCRKSYIHPEVLAAFAEGRLQSATGAKPARALQELLRQRDRSLGQKLRASLRMLQLSGRKLHQHGKAELKEGSHPLRRRAGWKPTSEDSYGSIGASTHRP